MAYSFDCPHTCCFTGSRPEKLGFDWQTNVHQLHMLRRDLKHAILRAIAHEYTCFITGMCKGFDLWAAQAVLELQAVHPQIELVCAIPFSQMSRNWSSDWRNLFEAVAARSNHKEILYPCYSAGCYHTRDRYMVDKSSRVICWYNGTKGGTEYTVQYAQKQGRLIDNLYISQMCIL